MNSWAIGIVLRPQHPATGMGWIGRADASSATMMLATARHVEVVSRKTLPKPYVLLAGGARPACPHPRRRAVLLHARLLRNTSAGALHLDSSEGYCGSRIRMLTALRARQKSLTFAAVQ